MIRTQPNSKSLCTIEAIALSLSLLEDNDEIAEVRVFVVQDTLLAVNGRCGGRVVRALISRSSGPGLSSASLHPYVQMGAGKINTGGNPAID